MSKIKDAFLNNLPEDEMLELVNDLDLSDEPKESELSPYLSLVIVPKDFRKICTGEITSLTHKYIRVLVVSKNQYEYRIPKVGQILKLIECVNEPGGFTGRSVLIQVMCLKISRIDDTFTIGFKVISEVESTKKSKSSKVSIQFQIALNSRSARDVENLLSVISQQVELVEIGKTISFGDYYEIGYELSERNLLEFLNLLNKYIGKVYNFVCEFL